ncbi:MAG: hypothetical protein K2F87_06035, partial [Muribaculaceae bacterium]|nr:hypothetical protein [Muribaculaceae bacterium]
MKYSFKTPTLAAILISSMSLASCSSRLSDEPEAPGNDRRMYVQLAVAPAPETETTENPGTDAECAIDPERLYIATYKEDGTKIAEIFAGAETDDVKFYPSSLWGPSVVTRLSYDDHKDGFYLVAYVLPENHYTLTGDFKFPANGKTGNFPLTMPGTSGTTATLW